MSEEQEPFEIIMRKMCASVLRDMQPQAAEAEQAAKEARAELRDRFAMAALIGLMAEGSHPRALCAEEAYFHADAMLKARGDD